MAMSDVCCLLVLFYGPSFREFRATGLEPGARGGVGVGVGVGVAGGGAVAVAVAADGPAGGPLIS
jgi:hypothetical protein